IPPRDVGAKCAANVAWSVSFWPASSPPVLVQRTRLLPQLLTRTGAPNGLGQVAGFSPERWPPSHRNGGRLRVGIHGRLQFADRALQRAVNPNRSGRLCCEVIGAARPPA